MRTLNIYSKQTIEMADVWCADSSDEPAPFPPLRNTMWKKRVGLTIYYLDFVQDPTFGCLQSDCRMCKKRVAHTLKCNSTSLVQCSTSKE